MNYRLPQWQEMKNAKPLLNSVQLEIAIAMVLTDASMARVSTQAYMKIEQGYKQLEFVQHLWSVFSDYSWGDSYLTRMDTTISSPRFGLEKSYWFKTFSHAAFTQAENHIVSNELNAKFGLNSKVITHKVKYWVVQIPARDASVLRELIKPHMLPMFAYKIPR